MHSVQWRNAVAPRVLFEMRRYKLSAKAHQLTLPVRVCIAEYDREAWVTFYQLRATMQ